MTNKEILNTIRDFLDEELVSETEIDLITDGTEDII